MFEYNKRLLNLMSIIHTCMIHLLNTISIIAVAMTGILIVWIVLKDVSPDERVEKIIKAPSVVMQFKKKRSGIEASQLLEQAKVFAQHLDARIKTDTTFAEQNEEKASPQVPPIPPKFKVVAISYCADNPEMSMALIDKPGKGRHWVKQFRLVDHFFIEQIENGVVVCKNDKGSFKLPIKQKSEAFHLKEVHLAHSRMATLHRKNLGM
ncbi:hypothetical protein ACFL5Z_13895 [Planctomycetota bacterium]